jgi:hypothetical protein
VLAVSTVIVGSVAGRTPAAPAEVLSPTCNRDWPGGLFIMAAVVAAVVEEGASPPIVIVALLAEAQMAK